MNRPAHRRAPRRLAGLVALTALAASGLAGITGSAQAQPVELIENGTFDAGTAPWWWTGNVPSAVTDGRLCAQVPGATANPWDAIIGQNDLPLQNGESYEFSFDASASVPVGVLAKVQQQTEPWPERLSRPVILGPESQHFSFAFTSGVDSDIEQVAFQIGGSAQPWTLCLDNVSLTGGAPPPVYVPDTGPRVRVNQVGYLSQGPKNATVVTAATDPLSWSLADQGGRVVASGLSTPRGVDTASNQNVHTIDFSGVTAPGTAYTLTADGETSYPFAIGDVYQALRSDALEFFAIQRSGIAIDGALHGEQYARPAGHVGVAPNTGDTDVPCQPGVCDYRLDVRGGWYDAGDHGKYVVNGGIATYQLLNTYERTLTAPTAVPGALADGTLRVPERGNEVPDVLDEARWELEFLLRMQVPAGQPLAGMAHHKVHDNAWTGLPLAPEDDPMLRELHPANTAATLNLAATAAQCGRLFLPYDRAFATRCLAAARTAYAAAKAHPDILADPNDGNGGGAYSDGDVSDEFYWAAAELYLTTGESAFLADLRSSPHHTGDVFAATGFNWPATAALGRLDLATVPNGLPAAERAAIRRSVTEGADAYLATLSGQAYGLPMPGGRNNYFWGSNSNIINNAIVLATAFDLTGERRYRDGAVQAMDYIFGRNALNHSYVTGWGTKAPRNQHSRMFGAQLDPNSPHPPDGSIAGGANANLEDPFANELLDGCAPQFCYVDDIQSYSTNEVAINWNSALAWIASFLADQADGAPVAPGSCTVGYRTHAQWPGAFVSEVRVTNTARTALDGWTVSWSYPTGQRIRLALGADARQEGPTVSARNQPWNRRVEPGRSVVFALIGAAPLSTNPSPELFRLNGKVCG
ncbi:MAG TPA: glycoside hydrolase family 9 protein [Actinophytocola sp.]|uniref:glycoside hydrolase family 9 protein n=1 Tax=Actinophytocola sp. TaxID=1872138 RepID=UPI002DBDF25A|nr:glycoside hydrolase family 9 protein [Actinophytocola sp.]HEU5472283.1 glycoside hydrolase family 9 protein [Actinophytocola sp.]